jgi:hypothetical protein
VQAGSLCALQRGDRALVQAAVLPDERAIEVSGEDTYLAREALG